VAVPMSLRAAMISLDGRLKSGILAWMIVMGFPPK
jgi:hypothetical protein